MLQTSERSVGFVVGGPLDTPTGGYRYDRRIIEELRALGWSIHVVKIDGEFPAPGPPSRDVAVSTIAQLTARMPVIVDGLVYGALGDRAAEIARSRPLIVLVHHPLALETGLTKGEARNLAALERAALRHATAVIVTSPATASRLVEDYGVPPHHISIAVPGVDRAIGSGRQPHEAGAPVRFLSVGSLIPRKGYLDLIAAFAQCMDLTWRCEIVGDVTLDPRHAAAVRDAIRSMGLTTRIRLAGAVSEDELTDRYQRNDCFVLATHYEGYGMAFSEALAAGLPVIGTTGALDAIGDGGLTITPGDVTELASRLRAFVLDADLRKTLAAKATRRALDLPTWRACAVSIARVIEAIS